ncbi:uncharacterized protein [Montipora capricornis]|uniref:uncharacterized protein n=1 Tax=Montipora capricornis TaxID=246305 RepID=UPI0035F109B4
MRLGPPIEEVKEEPVEEEVMKDAMIYGKNLAKPLSEYQIAVNKAAGKLALQSPVLLSNRGELYEKAREQVKVDGYSFKKGFSRSNSGTSSCSSSETETVSPKVKRAKRDKMKGEKGINSGNSTCINTKSAQRGMPSSLSTSEEGEEYHTEREKSMSDESKVTSPTGSERVEPPTAIEDAPSPTDTVILQGSTDEEDVRDFALTPPVTKELEGDLNIF